MVQCGRGGNIQYHTEKYLKITDENAIKPYIQYKVLVLMCTLFIENDSQRAGEHINH